MNIRAKSKPQRWQKLALLAAIFVLAVGYHFARPSLEKMLGRSLPSIMGDDNAQVDNGNDGDSKVDFDFDSVTIPQSKDGQATGKRNNSDQGTQSTAKSNAPSKFGLTETGRDRYESPAGLTYTMGPVGEHRIEHVMRHSRDMASRPSHGVFDCDKYEILMLLDDAYELIKEKSKRARITKEGNRTKNIVDMQRKVGYEGGQKGKRNGHRSLNKVMLILQDGNRVITAYPYR